MHNINTFNSNCPCSKNVSGPMSGIYDGAFPHVVNYFLGKFGNDYASALTELRAALHGFSYNFSRWFSCGEIMSLSDCYHIEELANIVNAYGNLVLEGKIPEYEKDFDSYVNDPNAKEFVYGDIEKANSVPYSIMLIAQASDRPESRVWEVMNMLVWIARQDDLRWNGILRPLTTKKLEETYLQTPGVWDEHVKGTIEKFGESMSATFNVAKYAVPALLVTAGAIYLGFNWKMFKGMIGK